MGGRGLRLLLALGVVGLGCLACVAPRDLPTDPAPAARPDPAGASGTGGSAPPSEGGAGGTGGQSMAVPDGGGQSMAVPDGGAAVDVASPLPPRRDAGADSPAAAVDVRPPPALVRLTITVDGHEGDHVTSSPGGIDCPTACDQSFEVGQTVTLTAIPASDATFLGWTGACQGAATTCQVVIAGPASVHGQFQPRPGSQVWSTARSGVGDFGIRGDSIFVTSEFRGTGTWGDQKLTSAGDADSALAEYDLEGRLRWVKRFGGPGYDSLYRLYVASDGLVLGGGITAGTDLGGQTFVTASDFAFALVQYDFTGNLMWWTEGGGGMFVVPHAGQYLASSGIGAATLVSAAGKVAGEWLDIPYFTLEGVPTADGGLAVGGHINDMTTFAGRMYTSVGPQDAFVARLSPTGAPVWFTVFSGGGAEIAGSQMSVDSNGDIYVTGQFNQDISIAGKRFQTQGYEDIFVAKVSGRDGSAIWGRTFGGPTSDGGYAAVADGTSVLIGGFITGSVDFGDGLRSGNGYVARLSAVDGQLIWASHIQQTDVRTIRVGNGDVFAAGNGALMRLRP
jgi:Divergent InlB B-repeat domain